MKIKDNNKNILVSIVIPTYNRSALLKRCLDSILNQTYKNIEIIVVDDNSTDDTQKIIGEYRNIDSRIVSLMNKNKGGNFARNEGIFNAKGEYIALMDDDDVCLPTRIEDQLNAVINNDYNYDFVISGYQIGDKNGNIKKTINFLKPVESIGLTVRWFVKTDKLKEVNGFDTSQPSLQEVELFWRLKEKCKIFFDSSIVVVIIGADVSITKNPETMICGIERLLEIHKNRMSLKEQNHWRYSLAIQYARSGKWDLYYSTLKINWSKYFGKLDILLFISYFFKSLKMIVLYSRLKNYFYFRKKITVYEN